jgi:hypothetical protein
MRQHIRPILLFTLLWGLQGCGGDQTGVGAGDSAGTAGGVQRTASAPGAAVFIISPKNGEIVNSPLNVKFGISGIAVAPAGELTENSGHHHLIIDASLTDMAGPVPNDERHHHFGKGQTEASIELGPGSHTLQLVLGDWAHIPHDPPVVSKIITITVE